MKKCLALCQSVTQFNDWKNGEGREIVEYFGNKGMEFFHNQGSLIGKQFDVVTELPYWAKNIKEPYLWIGIFQTRMKPNFHFYEMLELKEISNSDMWSTRTSV